MGSMDQVLPLPALAAAPSAPPAPADLVAQLGSEVAATLSSALERVNTLATTGRIDHTSLRALREEIEFARRAGMMGQQLSRLASGTVQLNSEPMDISAMLREALRQRGREIEARGIELRQQLEAAEVLADTTLTFSLLQAVLDWAFEHACGRIDLTVDHQAWPPHARLLCAFALQAPDEVDSRTPVVPDTLSWRLLEQTASTLGLPVVRHEAAGRTTLIVEFPRTVAARLRGDAVELDAQAALETGNKPLVGSHVLVVAARREIRSLVREALRPHGLMIDFVTSLEEAREFCRGGLPHAVVHEAALGGDAFGRLRQELLAEVPTLAFVQITEDNRGFEVRPIGGRQSASVGRAAIVTSLPAALMFELARFQRAV